MLTIEVAAVICAAIWAAAHLIKHFMPSSYERLEQNTYNPIADRVKAIEEHLNLNKPTQE